MLFIALFTYNPNDIVFKKVPCTKKIEYEIKLMYNIKLLKKDGLYFIDFRKGKHNINAKGLIKS
mgnify:CR=1 FL=1